jgi:hypothetical protein
MVLSPGLFLPDKPGSLRRCFTDPFIPVRDQVADADRGFLEIIVVIFELQPGGLYTSPSSKTKSVAE